MSSFEDAGAQRLTTFYEANELNQYTSVQNAPAVPLRGDAKRDAVVTVNGERTERDSGTANFTPWSYALSSSNSDASFQNTDILAVAQGTTGEDVEQRESGSVFIPATETILEYDDDGNMTFDGRFRYSWNGENRMILAEEAVAPTNRAPTVITYAYDEQGRMVSKNIVGTTSIARSLLWDGYNIVRETDNGISTYNVWGLDLDGTVQGCGGVGGLLAVAKTNGLHVGFYDANGNVSDYMSTTGAIAAHHEYSPFGEPLLSQDESFTHQFSTKPYCAPTGLSEYQLRKYNIAVGSWSSRDSFDERVGLYVFCGNDIANKFDLFGLKWTQNGVLEIFCCSSDASIISEIHDKDIIVIPFKAAFQEWRYSDGHVTKEKLNLRGNTKYTNDGIIIRIQAALSNEEAASALFHEFQHTEVNSENTLNNSLDKEVEVRIRTEQFRIRNGLPPSYSTYRKRDEATGIEVPDTDAIRDSVYNSSHYNPTDRKMISREYDDFTPLPASSWDCKKVVEQY